MIQTSNDFFSKLNPAELDINYSKPVFKNEIKYQNDNSPVRKTKEKPAATLPVSTVLAKSGPKDSYSLQLKETQDQRRLTNYKHHLKDWDSYEKRVQVHFKQ